MKLTIVIPTYWSKTEKESCKGIIYDHPTSLSSRGTLSRTLSSLLKQKNKDFNIVITSSASPEIIEAVESKVNKIIQPYRKKLRIFQFSYSDLKKVHERLKNRGWKKPEKIVNLDGYPNVRNIGFAVAHIIGSEIVHCLDDDEILTDKAFTLKARQFIGKNFQGKFIGGVAGYYIGSQGSYFFTRPQSFWKRFFKLGWYKDKWMRHASKMLDSKLRIQRTPFSFGGNSIIHRKMFEKVPFDPWVTRGEDMDLVLNARLFGFEFVLDNQLFVLHKPPVKPYAWLIMRQDILRFLYMRKKILYQLTNKETEDVYQEGFDPYPGHFLKSGIIYGFISSSLLRAIHSFLTFKFREAGEYLKNILIALFKAPSYAKKHAKDYLKFQKQWVKMMKLLKDDPVLKRYFISKY